MCHPTHALQTWWRFYSIKLPFTSRYSDTTPPGVVHLTEVTDFRYIELDGRAVGNNVIIANSQRHRGSQKDTKSEREGGAKVESEYLGRHASDQSGWEGPLNRLMSIKNCTVFFPRLFTGPSSAQ